MRWFFFHLYHARLLTPNGVYKDNKWPLSLELTYKRTIKKTDLIKTTQNEWQRIGVDYESQWLDRLGRMWPDVTGGDVLLFNVSNNGLGEFYYNGELIGGLDDAEFSGAFLSIWLSKKARDQSLRSQLVGSNRQSNNAVEQ